MPIIAFYDAASPSPQPILTVRDTDQLNYGGNAPATGEIELTVEQWKAWLSAPGQWTVSEGNLVPYTPPAPPLTLAQQASQALLAGLKISSASTPALDGTYVVDESAQARMNRIAVYLQVNGTFPGSASTITWLDASGAKHTFDAAQFKALATAIGDYVAAIDDVILGLSTTLPSPSATFP